MPGVPTDMPDFLEIGSFAKIAISVISDLALPNSSCNVCLLTQKTSIEILLTNILMDLLFLYLIFNTLVCLK